jgi:hypothetical protein
MSYQPFAGYNTYDCTYDGVVAIVGSRHMTSGVLSGGNIPVSESDSLSGGVSCPPHFIPFSPPLHMRLIATSRCSVLNGAYGYGFDTQKV